MGYLYVELFVYIVFLAGSLYLYVYALGNLKQNNPLDQAKYQQYVAKNGRWLRILSLAVTAIMTINIYYWFKLFMAI